MSYPIPVGSGEKIATGMYEALIWIGNYGYLYWYCQDLCMYLDTVYILYYLHNACYFRVLV